MAGALCLAVLLLAPHALSARIHITEIMFDPVAGRGTEYIELYNDSSADVPMRNWRIVDATGTTQAALPRSAVARARRRLVIAADSLIYEQFPWLRDSTNVVVLDRASLGLNASGDAVVVLDERRVRVDSVVYDDDWHRPDLDDPKGTSIERASTSAPTTSARNWTTSVGPRGGTPGAPNSIEIAPRVSDAEITVDPPTVSPDADGFQDLTRIAYRLPTRTARIVVAVLDRWGRPIDVLANNELAGAEGEIIWNGLDRHGMPLVPDIYIVSIEAYDALGVGLTSARTGIVVARR